MVATINKNHILPAINKGGNKRALLSEDISA